MYRDTFFGIYFLARVVALGVTQHVVLHACDKLQLTVIAFATCDVTVDVYGIAVLQQALLAAETGTVLRVRRWRSYIGQRRHHTMYVDQLDAR